MSYSYLFKYIIIGDTGITIVFIIIDITKYALFQIVGVYLFSALQI